MELAHFNIDTFIVVFFTCNIDPTEAAEDILGGAGPRAVDDNFIGVVTG